MGSCFRLEAEVAHLTVAAARASPLSRAALCNPAREERGYPEVRAHIRSMNQTLGDEARDLRADVGRGEGDPTCDFSCRGGTTERPELPEDCPLLRTQERPRLRIDRAGELCRALKQIGRASCRERV